MAGLSILFSSISTLGLGFSPVSSPGPPRANSLPGYGVQPAHRTRTGRIRVCGKDGDLIGWVSRSREKDGDHPVTKRYSEAIVVQFTPSRNPTDFMIAVRLEREFYPALMLIHVGHRTPPVAIAYASRGTHNRDTRLKPWHFIRLSWRRNQGTTKLNALKSRPLMLAALDGEVYPHSSAFLGRTLFGPSHVPIKGSLGPQYGKSYMTAASTS